MVALVSCVGAVQLQGQWSVGAGGGLTRIGLSGDSPSGSSWAANFGFGAHLHVEYDLGNDVSLTLQPDYHTRKSAQQFTIALDDGAIFSRDTTVDSAFISTSYASIPIGMRVYTTNKTWFFSTGLAAHFLQSIEIDTLTGTFEPENAISSTDASAFVGVGYLIPVGDPFGVSIEARYQLGIIDIIGEGQLNSFREAAVVRMSGFTLRATFEWRLFE